MSAFGIVAAAAVVDVHAGLSQSLVVLVTVATALVFGLVVLRRPSAATSAWGIAFGLGLLATYTWVTADFTGMVSLRAFASGLMLSFEPLVWLGLRWFAGRRTGWIGVAVFAVVVPSALAVSAGTAWFAFVFSATFAAAGVYAALIVRELARLQVASRDITLPLMLASAAFVVVAFLNAIWQLMGAGMPSEQQFTMLRQVNGMGTLITSYCAAVTILLLVRADPAHRARGLSSAAATSAMRERMDRIREHADDQWSMLDVRLDDPADLREASGQSDFAAIIERFHLHVREALPPAADIVRRDDTQLVVLLPGSDEAVEHHLRTLLNQVAIIDDHDPRAAIRVSASVGWARVRDGQFDFDALLSLAASRAERARDRGGDRWETTRVDAPRSADRAD